MGPKNTDHLANRPGLEAAPDTLLCVPLADSEGAYFTWWGGWVERLIDMVL